MNIESLLPFALIITPFAIAFLIEAVVIYFFKLKRPIPAAGIAITVNLVSLAVFFYAAVPLLGKLNYEINGLNLPSPVVFFFWWFVTVVEGLLLRIFLRGTPHEKIFKASIVMNALSTLFLYFFVVNSH